MAFITTWRDGRSVAEDSLTTWGQMGVTMQDVNRVLVEQGRHTDTLGWEMRQAGVDINHVGEVLEFLKSEGIDVIEVLQAQGVAVEDLDTKYRKLSAQIMAAANAQAQMTGQSAGAGLTALPVTREFVEASGSGVFGGMGARRQQQFLRERGLEVPEGGDPQEVFLRFFQQLVTGLAGQGMDRSDALMRAIRQVDGRASGGPASGLTLVGERGPELVSLPGGSYVHPNGTGPGGDSVYIDMSNTTIIGINQAEAWLKRIIHQELRQARSGTGRRR